MTEETTPTFARSASKVEARMICEWKKILDATSVEVTLRPSVQGRDNVEWAPYTPAGQVQLVMQPQAAALFVQGGRYAVTFERAELSDTHLSTPTETVGVDRVTPGH